MELIVCVIGMCIAFVLGMLSKKDNKPIIQNPVQVIKETKEEKKQIEKAKKEDEIINTIAYNIDHYNGTNTGQKDIPR